VERRGPGTSFHRTFAGEGGWVGRKLSLFANNKGKEERGDLSIKISFLGVREKGGKRKVCKLYHISSPENKERRGK